MDDIDTLKEIRRVLEVSLCELVDTSVASMGNCHVMNQWEMRDEGKAALATFGVPIELDDPGDAHLGGAVQASVSPEIVVPGSQGYRLGWDSGWTLAAMTPSGEVWAVDSLAASDRSTDTEIIRVNSSVAGFIDLSWRWQEIRPLLLKFGYRDSFFEAAELYLARLPVIDPALADEERYPWWRNMMLDW